MSCTPRVTRLMYAMPHCACFNNAPPATGAANGALHVIVATASERKMSVNDPCGADLQGDCATVGTVARNRAAEGTGECAAARPERADPERPGTTPPGHAGGAAAGAGRTLARRSLTSQVTKRLR